MSYTALILILMGLPVIALGVSAASRKLRERARLRSTELQRRFGPEYARAVERCGSTTQAERELEQRERRVLHFRFKDLGPAERARFTASWNEIQAKFATDPAVAVTATNELINRVMRARGYPTLCFDQRVADLSVEHPTVIEHYRAAQELSRSVYNGVADTELLRQALVHYRILFTDLLRDSRGISAPPAPLRNLPSPHPVVHRANTVH